jgi:16S rRNA (cytosine1402-N4)-methyltransferase
VDELSGHTPVLTRAAVELLAVGPGDFVVDATVGRGGHAVLLAASLSDPGALLGLDVDPACLADAEKRLAGVTGRIVLQHRNFAELSQVLAGLDVERVDVILADLGLSSTQLDDPGRGFSFLADGPLDMRMDHRTKTTAADLVNRLREQELADLLYQYGQERFSRRIARRICAARRDGRITRTAGLADLVAAAVKADPKSRRSKIHPATRTFQALRIAVNDELSALEALLDCAPRHLNPGGRIGVISFHSLEDGRVKRDFRRRRDAGLYTVVTKKPIVADVAERKANPRSRSAKLRVAVRTEKAIPGE